LYVVLLKQIVSFHPSRRRSVDSEINALIPQQQQ
jgi:hypothetical protein